MRNILHARVLGVWTGYAFIYNIAYIIIIIIIIIMLYAPASYATGYAARASGAVSEGRIDSI